MLPTWHFFADQQAPTAGLPLDDAPECRREAKPDFCGWHNRDSLHRWILVDASHFPDLWQRLAFRDAKLTSRPPCKVQLQANSISNQRKDCNATFFGRGDVHLNLLDQDGWTPDEG